MSLAAFLLCLLGIYAISPVDYFLRAQVGGRGRTARTCRLDDHDHQDHALDAFCLNFGSLDSRGADGAGSDGLATVRMRMPSRHFGFSAFAVTAGIAAFSPVFPLIPAGRAPPLFC
jgi:hypothetical protein